MFMNFPYLALPLLIGQLRGAGYEVYTKDFTVCFFQNIANKRYIKKIYNLIKDIKKKYNLKDSLEFEKIFKLYNYIENNIDSNSSNKEIYKISLISFVLFPFYFFQKNFYPKQSDAKKPSIIEYCSNRNLNFYIQHLEDEVKKLPADIDVICISKIPDMELTGILTLAMLLKKKYKNKKIVLGGYWFSFIADELLEHPELFDIFCDYIMIGDGEKSLIELVEHIDSKRDISEVSNVVYRDKNNKVIKNGNFSSLNINNIQYADYSDYDFSQERTISMMLSKGCYWGKCKFCTHNYEKNFQIKTINNAINEIKHYIEKYKVEHISFVDDAISPKYYKHLSDSIIKNNINITFSSYVMFDEGFTKEILETCKNAGLSNLTWGVETHSKKVFDYISKSGCFDKRSEILKNAHEAGIHNTINIIEGLPGERHKDLIQTVKFVYDNIEYIDELCIQRFQLLVGSEFSLNPDLYELKITDKQEFSLFYDFEVKNSDIVEENSFYRFFTENNYQKNKSLKSVYQKELVKTEVTKYLAKYAPELL